MKAAPVAFHQGVGGVVVRGVAAQYGVKGALVQYSVECIRRNVRHCST